MWHPKDRMGRKLTAAEVLAKTAKRIINIFLDFELMLLRHAGHIPIHTVRIFLYRLAGITIGRGSKIHMWCNFYFPKNINIGQDTIIGDHAFLDGRETLKIGNHVAIASQVLIYNSQHDIDSEDFKPVSGQVTIEDHTFIGPRVIILPGVTIGRGAIVASGAVVTRNVDPFTVVGGIPAKFIRHRKLVNPQYRLGRARLFQ